MPNDSDPQPAPRPLTNGMYVASYLRQLADAVEGGRYSKLNFNWDGGSILDVTYTFVPETCSKQLTLPITKD